MLLSRLPRELVENVLFFYAIDGDGRPHSLQALQLTCRSLRQLIADSNALPARIFQYKFSTGRHAGLAELTSSNWRFQLSEYSRALECIERRCGLDVVVGWDSMEGESWSIHELLWVVFVMCHDDDDGANRRQLNAVGAYDYFSQFVLTRLYDGAKDGWPVENTPNTLALWIFWFLTTKACILSESDETSDRIVDSILPFVVAHFRYPTAWAPPNHFHLPLPSHVVLSTRRRSAMNMISVQTPHGSFPKYRLRKESWTLHLFEREVHVSLPLITIVAKLLFFARRECFAYQPQPNTPASRADVAPDDIRPTLEDIQELNRNLLGGPHGRGGGTRMGCSLARAEWARIRRCDSPWHSGKNTNMYSPGSLTGLWVGRMNIPSEPTLVSMVQTVQMPQGMNEALLQMISQPTMMRLQELVCPYGEPILPTVRGTATLPPIHDDDDDDDDMDDDMDESPLASEESAEINATLLANFDHGMSTGFMPPGFTMQDGRDGVYIKAPGLDREYLYRRLGMDHIAHDPDSCEGCAAREQEILWQGTDVPPCTAVQDVVFRGSTDRRHAQAWGDFNYYGRVRPWDGLVSIVRTHGTGVKLFMYGYITDADHRNLVGNWRLASDHPAIWPSYEGAFTMGRVIEQNENST